MTVSWIANARMGAHRRAVARDGPRIVGMASQPPREANACDAGGQLLVMEAMKMEHVVSAPQAGVVRHVDIGPGDTVYAGHALLHLEPVESGAMADA